MTVPLKSKLYSRPSSGGKKGPRSPLFAVVPSSMCAIEGIVCYTEVNPTRRSASLPVLQTKRLTVPWRSFRIRSLKPDCPELT